MTNQVKDQQASFEQMLLIEKHERVIAYLYPIVQRTPRCHGVARDKFLSCLFDQADLIMRAGKSKHISKIYEADANLGMIRFWIRFYRNDIKHLTEKQENHALSLVAEVGRIIGAWIKSKRATEA